MSTPADHDHPHDHVAYRRERIAEAHAHKAGWFDGDGDPITDAALAAAKVLSTDLTTLAPDEHWYVGGTEGGGMRFEATRTSEESETGFFHCTTVEIDPNGTDVYIHCLAVVDGGGRHESGHIETGPAGSVEKALELRCVVTDTLAATTKAETREPV